MYQILFSLILCSLDFTCDIVSVSISFNLRTQQTRHQSGINSNYLNVSFPRFILEYRRWCTHGSTTIAVKVAGLCVGQNCISYGHNDGLSVSAADSEASWSPLLSDTNKWATIEIGNPIFYTNCNKSFLKSLVTTTRYKISEQQ